VGPTIRSASLIDYPEIARSVGLDPSKMLERVGLPRSCLRNPDLRISAEAIAGLLDASASVARVDDFALRLAQRRASSCRKSSQAQAASGASQGHIIRSLRSTPKSGHGRILIGFVPPASHEADCSDR
jgi:hypothetical protein